MEDNKLTVKFNDSDVDINVIDIIDNLDNNKKYIVYNADGFDDDFYISILEEMEDSYTLQEITDENEFKMVEDYLESMLEEEEGNDGQAI